MLYGDGSFQGLINIITRKDQQVSVGFDEHGGRAGNAKWSQALRDWVFAGNLTAFASDTAIQLIGRQAHEQRSSAMLSAEQRASARRSAVNLDWVVKANVAGECRAH